MSQLRGGIHEGLSSRQTKYPFLLFTEVSAPIYTDHGRTGDKGTREIKALYDISILASKQVQADNLLPLVDALFTDAAQALDALVDGQTVYYCQRVGTMPTGPDRDDEGRYYVQRGGTFEIWTWQPLT
jgi:hypothetical protein